MSTYSKVIAFIGLFVGFGLGFASHGKMAKKPYAVLFDKDHNRYYMDKHGDLFYGPDLLYQCDMGVPTATDDHTLLYTYNSGKRETKTTLFQVEVGRWQWRQPHGQQSISRHQIPQTPSPVWRRELSPSVRDYLTRRTTAKKPDSSL